MQTVTFTVAVLPAEESALKTHSGITNGLVLDHVNGVGTPLVTEVTPGATLTDVALFIDTSKAALAPLAEEKYYWCVLLPCLWPNVLQSLTVSVTFQCTLLLTIRETHIRTGLNACL